MGRKTRSLIRLEHSVCKSILHGDIKVGLNHSSGVIDIPKLRIRSGHTAGSEFQRHLVGAIHRTVGISFLKRQVAVTEIVARRQSHRSKGDGLMFGVDAGHLDVNAGLEVWIAAKQVVGSAVLLVNNDNVVEVHRLCVRRREREC